MKKKGFILLTFCCLFCLFLTGCSANMSREDVAKLLGSNSIPVITIKASYSVDMEKLEEVIGDADYVFVGQVKQYVKTIYNTKGDKDFPKTVYSIRVVENIKGQLIGEKDIQVLKGGGVSKDCKQLVQYENDTLPIELEYYIFSVYAFASGEIIANGMNTSVIIENKSNYQQDVKYKDFVKAHMDEKVTNRKRYVSTYDTNKD